MPRRFPDDIDEANADLLIEIFRLLARLLRRLFATQTPPAPPQGPSTPPQVPPAPPQET